MRKIKVGVYYDNGCHQITREVLANPNINAEIVASCHCPNSEKLKNVTYYDTLEEMLKDERIELVSLCSPNRREQANDAVKCMLAGKHVYAEKPCAMSEEDLERILKTSEKTGKQFHEMAGTAFKQPYYALRKFILSDKIGDIVQIYSQKSYPLGTHRPQNEDIDGGLIRQVGIHNMRFTEHITGLKIKEIYAVQTKLGNGAQYGNLHTAVSYMMKMENGAVASAVANYMNNVEAIGKYGNECVRIFGTKGYAEIMDAGRKSRVIIGDKNMGELDTSENPKTYFECYIDSLLGTGEMPVSLEDELHPTRMVIRAAENCR